jgi:predicted glycoside hydrolase/deacetylase ChbG (UPF0249 family)
MSITKDVAQKYSITAARTFTPRKFDYTRLLSPKRTLISLYLLYQKSKWIKYGFRVCDRKDSLLRMGLDYNQAINYLHNVFNKLPHGTLEFAVHPGYINGNHIQLGTYINEREVELQALLSDDFKKLIDRPGIELIRFKDI